MMERQKFLTSSSTRIVHVPVPTHNKPPQEISKKKDEETSLLTQELQQRKNTIIHVQEKNLRGAFDLFF